MPTLVHDGRPVIQSSNIAEYLDEVFPDPPLKPENPVLRTQMREWMKEEKEFLFRLIVTLSFNTMMKMRAAVYGMDQLVHWSRRHPDQVQA
jgi:glutathione S-transferase